jgi:hypothetical protein
LRASPGGRSYSGPRSYGYTDRHVGRRHVHRHHHRHHRRFYGYVPFETYGYTGSCSYYYRRAVATGSAYWWRRYRDCIDD